MGQTLPTNARHLDSLHRAYHTGALSVVDENGGRLSLLEACGLRCWAHLRDSEDGKVYVHEPGRQRRACCSPATSRCWASGFNTHLTTGANYLIHRANQYPGSGYKT
ncbi:hypothetical protein ACFQT0_19670 [Hymenobacter humi]|uniref:Uncharacterized protein n=1 Tax=Hymenobacter humi TaxID=1411620 RepID=A0ABW2U738_9BACT